MSEYPGNPDPPEDEADVERGEDQREQDRFDRESDYAPTDELFPFTEPYGFTKHEVAQRRAREERAA